MEADEIRLVLERASELHAKISEAIERALKSEFMRTICSRMFDSNVSSVNDADERDGYGSSDNHRSKAIAGGDQNAEARALGLIRDALETLEDQLEALQLTQSHQRVEKDALLAELEENRHLLLHRLKNHQGREWEVVHEALVFAGEPMEETDDLLLQPHHKPLLDIAFKVDDESSKHLPQLISLPQGRADKLLMFSKGDEVDKKDDRCEVVPLEGNDKQHSQEKVDSSNYKVVAVRGNDIAGGFMRGLRGGVGHALAHAAKAALVVASVVAFLALTEHNHRQVQQKPLPVSPAVEPHFLPESHPRPLSSPQCSRGKKPVVLEDGNAECVVMERFEIPFPRKIRDPNVLHGRG